MFRQFKNILIVGAGAVGGFFGAHLAKRYTQVSFLLRTRTCEAVRAHGLTVRSPSGNFTINCQVDSDVRNLPRPDLIILGIKVYDLEKVLEQIEPIIEPNTVILTLQNGVTIEDQILARFQRNCVIGGVAFIYSKIAAPGVIDHYKRGTLTVGELMGNESKRVLGIAKLFQQAGIPCQVSSDIRKAKWEKMCWNCVFNPLTVIINDQVSRALGQPGMPRIIASIVEEVAAIASAHKIHLDEDIADQVVRWSQDIRDIHTSMYDDWKAGRPTEIDSLNGYIVMKGQEFGIPTPINGVLAAVVKVMTSQDRST